MKDSLAVSGGCLTETQTAAYWTDGYLFPIQVATPSQAKTWRRALEQVERDWRDNGLPLPLNTYKRVNAQGRWGKRLRHPGARGAWSGQLHDLRSANGIVRLAKHGAVRRHPCRAGKGHDGRGPTGQRDLLRGSIHNRPAQGFRPPCILTTERYHDCGEST